MILYVITSIHQVISCTPTNCIHQAAVAQQSIRLLDFASFPTGPFVVANNTIVIFGLAEPYRWEENCIATYTIALSILHLEITHIIKRGICSTIKCEPLFPHVSRSDAATPTGSVIPKLVGCTPSTLQAQSGKQNYGCTQLHERAVVEKIQQSLVAMERWCHPFALRWSLGSLAWTVHRESTAPRKPWCPCQIFSQTCRVQSRLTSFGLKWKQRASWLAPVKCG